ncbi:MAG: hypothetical protein OXU77_19780 [Gammaproteobacteria bacterium]|nr:hypothetical protein [Gammaproteobacteria bacterium]MDE0441407.1 hypothetical protein [Gammaproteobacteria bacterium]
MASRIIGTLRNTRLARHPLAPILVAAVALAVIGSLLPPRSTDGATGPGMGGGRPVPPLAPPEDLADFRTMSRWGTNIAMVEDGQGAPVVEPASGLNPELVKLGFIGLSRSAGEIAVLLTHPDGHTRLTGGDSLPDGRTLFEVTDNDLTLEDADGRRETLVLFPRVSASETDEP